MDKIKIGYVVARKSYDYDIYFIVNKIIQSKNNRKIAILKGITSRIVADAYVEDLVILDNKKLDDSLRSLDNRIEDRINSFIKKGKDKFKSKERELEYEKTGKILHLDGDNSFVYTSQSGLNTGL